MIDGTIWTELNATIAREYRLRALFRAASAGWPGGGLGAAPVGEELREKCVLVVRLDRQRRQCEGHRKRGVIAERS